MFKFGIAMGALQNQIKADPIDPADARARLGRMKMVVPDLAEV